LNFEVKDETQLKLTIFSPCIVRFSPVKAPRLLADFTHLCLENKNKECKQLFTEFRQGLDNLGDEIELKNKNRTMPCNAFNPHLMTSSVSI
jgi:hypothetical protein